MQIGLVIVGVDHCMAPAHLVERMRECEDTFRGAFAQLRGNVAIGEALHCAFPTRTDIVVATRNSVAAANAVLDVLTRIVRLNTEEWSAFYRHLDQAAVGHLLRVVTAPDGEQATIQLESCRQLSHKSGLAGPILDQLTRDVMEHARVIRSCSNPADSLRGATRQTWGRIQAEACLPPCAKFRSEVDAICAEEVATFRRSCGGLMTDEQEKAVKIVTARISERVGQWINRAWDDSGQATARVRDDS